MTKLLRNSVSHKKFNGKLIMTKTLVDYFVSLVKIDSESKNEKEIALKLAEDLKNLGGEVRFDDANKKTGGNVGNLYAYFPGNIAKEPILFCAHLDTVIPGNGVNPQILEDRITSDGTTILGADDKSGIAQIIWAIKELKNTKTAPIEVLFTISEEIGLLGAKYLDYSMIKSKIGFALDTHKVGAVVIGAPFQNSMKFTIHGKEAHAGSSPEYGVNAIKIAAEAISKMPSGRIDNETTCNIGLISGGDATNIVPNKVVIEAESRSHDKKKLMEISNKMKNAVLSAVQNYKLGDFSASVEVEIEEEYQAFRVDENAEIVKLGQNAAQKMDLNSYTIIGGGGSDVNIFNQNGLQMVIVGTGMDAVHTVKEFIKINELKAGAEWVRNAILLYSEI